MYWTTDHFLLPLLLNGLQQIGLDFPHASGSGSGFARVDSVRGSGAAVPGRCHRYARSGLATNHDRICSHSPSKGSLWVRRQPSTRFLRSCSRYRIWSPATRSWTFPSTGSFPAVQRSTEKMRMGVEGRDKTTGEQPKAQQKTACCNCSACWNRRMGSSACATSSSSYCFWAGRTPDSRRRCSGVLAGS